MDITRKVGDVEYSFQRMKTMDSLVFKATLVKMIGPGLAGLDFNGKSVLDSDVIKAIGAALSGSNPQQVALFIKDTIRKMVVHPIAPGKNGTEDTFDKYYQDREWELLEAFAACVIVQTGDVAEQLKKKFFTKGSGSVSSAVGNPS